MKKEKQKPIVLSKFSIVWFRFNKKVFINKHGDHEYLKEKCHICNGKIKERQSVALIGIRISGRCSCALVHNNCYNHAQQIIR